MEIAEIIGLPATTRLVEAYGGRRLFVPKHSKTQHKLAHLLGFEQARRMSHHFGGECLFIARGTNTARAKRNAEITRAFDTGTSVPALARAHQLTERQIYTILSKPVQRTTRLAG